MTLVKLRHAGLVIRRLSSSTTSSTPPVGAPPKPPAKPTPAPSTDPTRYNVPEYFQHNQYSYYDIDGSIFKHRISQPSKYDPLIPKK